MSEAMAGRHTFREQASKLRFILRGSNLFGFGSLCHLQQSSFPDAVVIYLFGRSY